MACTLAPAARLSAKAAVLVHAGVLLALLRAQPAGLGADLQLSPDQAFVRARSARPDFAGREADIGAIEIEADALRQVRDHLLA